MNERMMILKMLDEGKITLEEADALLEALGTSEGKDAAAEPEVVARPAGINKSTILHGDADSSEEELLDEVEDRFDSMSDGLDDMEDSLDEQLEELDEQLEEIDENEELSSEDKDELRRKIAEAQRQVEERRMRIKENRHRLKEQEKDYIRRCKTGDSIASDIRRGMDEVARTLEDLRFRIDVEGQQEIKKAMREVSRELNNGMRELRNGLNEGARELRNGLNEGARELRRAFKGNDIRGILGGIFNSIGIGHWAGFTLEEELTGILDPALNPQVDIQTSNGRIEVIGTDQAEYKLVLHYEIATDNQADAERLKEKMCQVTQSPGLLKVETTEHRLGAVSVKLLVPASLTANYKLRSSNGRIVLTGLKSDSRVQLHSSNGRLEMADLRLIEVNGHTSNGRIEIKDFATERLDLHTSNGSIYIDGICSQVVGKTSNGTITAYPRIVNEGDMRLNTSNGRIKVVVCDPEVGVDIKAHTTMGSISLDFPELVYSRQVNQHMRKDYEVHSANYGTQGKKLRLEAGTSMGSIYLGQREE